MFRDWMMGQDMRTSNKYSFGALFRSPLLTRALMLVIGAVYLLSEKKGVGNAFAFIPYVIGMGQQKSVLVYSKDAAGMYKLVTIHEPRDWRFGTEMISLPREHIDQDGQLAVKLIFTKRHQLRFAGVIQGQEEEPYRREELRLENADHSRKGEIEADLAYANTSLAHMIPGDTIDLIFSDPTSEPANNESITYLMQSSGFYTALRPEYARIAGDWQTNLSEEARKHYDQLAPVRS